MAKEPEFKKGEKGYLKRFVNIFQSDAKTALDDFTTNTNNAISEVNGIKTSLTNEINSVKENIASLEEKETELQNKLDEVSNFYTSNFEENEDGEIVSEEIEGYVEKFKGYKAEIDELKTQINDYKSDLFGTEDEEGNEIKGLDHKIDSLKNQLQSTIKESEAELNKFLEQNGEKRDELFNRIEGLLKGASTVALAKAFKEHKDSFIISNYIWMALFVLSIISMMALSVWGFVNANYEFKDMWKYTLGNLPFIGGAIWLAIYSSKQRSQNKRLQQEYAFKEDVAKIYYGLKEEVEELGDSELGKKLNESVLKLVIDVVSLNPSETLDNKSHNDKGPIVESIKNLGEVVKNIKNPT
jgi:predicted  nucleic acid-binding Zn-ribbon protein